MRLSHAKIVSGRLMDMLRLNINETEKDRVGAAITTCLALDMALSKANLTISAEESTISSRTWFRLVEKLNQIHQGSPEVWDVADSPQDNSLTRIIETHVSDIMSDAQRTINAALRSKELEIAALRTKYTKQLASKVAQIDKLTIEVKRLKSRSCENIAGVSKSNIRL